MFEIGTTAEDFLSAFKALPKSERNIVVARMTEDQAVARDMIDLLTITSRRDQPRRKFRTYLASRANRAKRT